MKEPFAYDRVLRDLFQMDNPSLLEQLTGGLHVREFLNVQFPKTLEQRADLVALLEDDSIFHFEIQGQNDMEIEYRQGFYCLMISQQYRRPLSQVILYVGQEKLRMKSELHVAKMDFKFTLIDIREFDAAMLLRSGSAGDLALAMLAKGGTEQLADIAQKAAGLSGQARARVLTQLVMLSGLRKLSEKVKMELENMGSLLIDIQENVILREIFEKGMAKGKAKGEAEGEAVGMLKLLRGMLRTKFGRIPKWADKRLESADKAQLEQWSNKLIHAQHLEDAIGKK